MTTSMVPNLWFDGDAEQAAEFYTSVFPNSSIDNVMHTPDGSVVVVEFTLDGNRFAGINGGPMFTFSEAISFAIATADQAEADRYWDALTADGGQESQCGWLKDRYGLSWQVYPAQLGNLLGDPDPLRAQAAHAAMMQQRRIDLAEIRAAADAASASQGGPS
ncbi:MAG TPA: VOC family protein [Ilumatobacteraceae bacterium]|nr:VOC family protein [Ilumatobacteraceae bacterium]